MLMRVRARARQRGVEFPLVVSDHADWDGLTKTITATGASEIWVTHGQEDALVHWSQSRGLKARPLDIVGYGDEDSNAVIELTHNWDQKEPYVLGSAFGHLALATPDIYATCKRLEAEGVKIPRPPGPMKHGGSVIAFIEDPDGYKIELIERP